MKTDPTPQPVPPAQPAQAEPPRNRLRTVRLTLFVFIGTWVVLMIFGFGTIDTIRTQRAFARAAQLQTEEARQAAHASLVRDNWDSVIQQSIKAMIVSPAIFGLFWVARALKERLGLRSRPGSPQSPGKA